MRYRALMRYYTEALRGLGIEVTSLTTVRAAEDSLIKAMRWQKTNTKHSAAVVENMKSAVCVTFGYNSEWPRLTSSSAVRATIKAIRREAPVINQKLKLTWHISQLWQYYRSMPPLPRLTWYDLIGKTICLVSVYGRLRITELEPIDAETEEPLHAGFPFVTLIKLHDNSEVIIVPRVKELALCPVQYLLEVRERIRKKRSEVECMEETTFWMKENGKRMKYEEIRQAAFLSVHGLTA